MPKRKENAGEDNTDKNPGASKASRVENSPEINWDLLRNLYTDPSTSGSTSSIQQALNSSLPQQNQPVAAPTITNSNSVPAQTFFDDTSLLDFPAVPFTLMDENTLADLSAVPVTAQTQFVGGNDYSLQGENVFPFITNSNSNNATEEDYTKFLSDLPNQTELSTPSDINLFQTLQSGELSPELQQTIELPTALYDNHEKNKKMLEIKRAEMHKLYIDQANLINVAEPEKSELQLGIGAKISNLFKEIEELNTEIGTYESLIANQTSSKKEEVISNVSNAVPQRPDKFYGSIAAPLLKDMGFLAVKSTDKIYIAKELAKQFRTVTQNAHHDSFSFDDLLKTYYQYPEFRQIVRGSQNIANNSVKSQIVSFKETTIADLFYVVVKRAAHYSTNPNDVAKLKKFIVDYWQDNEVLQTYVKNGLADKSKRLDKINLDDTFKDIIKLFAEDEAFLSSFFDNLSAETLAKKQTTFKYTLLGGHSLNSVVISETQKSYDILNKYIEAKPTRISRQNP